MNGSFFAGLEAACFGALTIVIAYLFPDRRRELSLNVLLCAAVLLLAAVAITFANLAYVLSGSSLLGRISGILSVVVDIAAGAAMAVFFWLWKPGKRNGNRLAAILTTLLPVWLAGICWIFTRETALFPVAGTLSLLIVVTFYQKSLEVDLIRRAEEVENHQAMVFQWQMRPHFLFILVCDKVCQLLCGSKRILA